MKKLLVLMLMLFAAPLAAQTASHDAAACFQACPGATYVEMSPKGDLCRCWAPDAFQYTFYFPDTAEKLSYTLKRWSTNIEQARQCRKDGKAWEPSQDRTSIVCTPNGVSPGRPF